MPYISARVTASATQRLTVGSHWEVSMRVSADGDSLSATGGVYDAEKSFTSMRRIFMS